MKPDLTLPFHTIGSLKSRIGWFINMRWIVTFIMLASIPVSQKIFQFQIAYFKIYNLISLLLCLNIGYFFLYKYFKFKNFKQELIFTEIQVIFDLVIISFLVHYIGGITNPFFFFYIIPITISSILFQKKLPYFNALVAICLLSCWSFLEYFNKVEIYYIGAGKPSFALVSTSLIAFLFLVIATTYVIDDFISKYRSIKSMMDQKNILLEKTMHENDKMFRFTAHELKSPLTTLRSILGVVELLFTQKNSREKIQDMLKRAEKRSDQILDMVNDMIDLTHYKQGKKEISLKYVKYMDWFKNRIDSFVVLANNENITLNFKPTKSREEIILDIPSIEKVVNNLISNAIRYTPAGGEVEITPFIKKNQFGFSVKDTGIGISQEDQEKIFSDFFRSKNAKQKSQLGTGLGLSLVKQIVNKYNGNIVVESELNKGSKFTVTIPKIEYL